MLDASDLSTYTAAQVASLADVDFLAVEKEGERRQNAAERKHRRAIKLMQEAAREMQEGEMILTASMRERARHYAEAA